jgi:hypothetical protein
MKKLLFLLIPFLFNSCNNQVKSDVNNQKDENTLIKKFDYRADSVEEAAKRRYYDRGLMIFSEQEAFLSDYGDEINKTFKIVDTVEFKRNYFFVFVEFKVGATTYQEVVSVKRIYDGSYINEYIYCSSVTGCDEDLDKRINEWNKKSIIALLR